MGDVLLPDGRNVETLVRESVTRALRESGYVVLEAGELPKMCAAVSRSYDREAAALTKNLATVIEPVLIVVVAAIVLVVALAVFLPMWDAFKLVG